MKVSGRDRERGREREREGERESEGGREKGRNLRDTERARRWQNSGRLPRVVP